MYYICKFSDSWSLYETEKNTSKPLEKEEINLLRQLFPAVLGDKMLIAVAISSIQPNKLMNLPMNAKHQTPPKPTGEPAKTTNVNP